MVTFRRAADDEIDKLIRTPFEERLFPLLPERVVTQIALATTTHDTLVVWFHYNKLALRFALDTPIDIIVARICLEV